MRLTVPGLIGLNLNRITEGASVNAAASVVIDYEIDIDTKVSQAEYNNATLNYRDVNLNDLIMNTGDYMQTILQGKNINNLVNI